jgi:transposase InsO family protein
VHGAERQRERFLCVEGPVGEYPPASRHGLLAHIRAEFSTSNETYGSPRMHAELKECGLATGRHRVARLMRENGLKARQKTRFKIVITVVR